MAIDGTTVDVPDSVVNDTYFGRAGVSKGERSAFPMARLVAVAECGTHAMVDAEIGPYSISEVALSEKLVDRLMPGTLVIADRGFYGYDLWTAAAATGADLLWRGAGGVTQLWCLLAACVLAHTDTCAEPGRWAAGM